MTTTTMPHPEPTTTGPGSGRAEALAIAGWVLAGFVGSLLLFDGVSRLLRALSLVETSAVIVGRPAVDVWIAIIALVFLALYLVPRTSVVGAILLTAYLGGELAANVRVPAPYAGYVVLVGLALWAALYLRNPQLRRLLPFRR